MDSPNPYTNQVVCTKPPFSSSLMHHGGCQKCGNIETPSGGASLAQDESHFTLLARSFQTPVNKVHDVRN